MKNLLRILRWILIALAGVLVLALGGAWLLMRASLPLLDGDRALPGLAAPVSVERDANGTARIKAANLPDALRALGFVHAQERYFEMDLARRSAAGELSALLGAVTLPMDRDKRRHRLRARMEVQLAVATPQERAELAAYTAGVNAGLAAHASRPWQYWVLRAEPEPWREVDSLLVVGEMFFMLQANSFEARYTDTRLRRLLGDALFDWLRPLGGHWDAAIDGSVIAARPMPGPELIDVRKIPAAPPQHAGLEPEQPLPGSNNWAIGGTRTHHGGAMLADDMHLGIGVPAIWFRAQLEIGSGTAMRRVAGVTLPGVPGVVVGSNGDIAWGFTNSYGQWFDWVAIPRSDAPTLLTLKKESIVVKGGDPVELEVRESAFGPSLYEDESSYYALWWSLYQPGAVNSRSSALMSAASLDEAIAAAQDSGIPHQNVVIADKAGNIAWTIMGRIPLRANARADRGRLTDAKDLPTGWLPREHYPLVKNPPDGQLFTANNRQMGGAAGALIGEGWPDLGARAGQIRDRLREKPKHREADLYAIQLDSESRFLKRWAELALRHSEASDKTRALAAELKRWNGRADIDQTGHRIVRAFRERVESQLWNNWIHAALKQPIAAATKDAAQPASRSIYAFDGRFEYAAWQALEARPEHLLPPPHATWDAFVVAQLEWVHGELTRDGASLAGATWGERNRARFRHPFSRAMPFLSRFLDMPAGPQAGDNHMPRVAAPTFGASQRLVVSPGREGEGILTLAGGQSGHPLSPFWAAGHADWSEGRPTPLLAGDTRYTLGLKP